MEVKRPYAVEEWRDKLYAYRTGKPEGYYLAKARYATREAAQRAADYRNVFNPVPPCRAVKVHADA